MNILGKARNAVFENRIGGGAASGISPVFVIGSGRSGNTLLRRMLMSGGDLYIPPETYVLGRLASTWKRTALAPWDTRVRAVLGYFATSEDFPSFPTQDLRDVFTKAIHLPPEDRSLAAVVDILYRELAAAAGFDKECRWGDKTPMNTYALEKIDLMFPGALYVHMIRDPLDVVSSYLKMGRYQVAEEAAQRWVDANTSCLSFAAGRGAGRVIATHYETLVRYPGEEIQRLCVFLGLRFLPEMLDEQTSSHLGDVEKHSHHGRVKAAIDSRSIGRGRERLSSDQIQTVSRICSPTQEFLSIQETPAFAAR